MLTKDIDVQKLPDLIYEARAKQRDAKATLLAATNAYNIRKAELYLRFAERGGGHYQATNAVGASPELLTLKVAMDRAELAYHKTWALTMRLVNTLSLVTSGKEIGDDFDEIREIQ